MYSKDFDSYESLYKIKQEYEVCLEISKHLKAYDDIDNYIDIIRQKISYQPIKDAIESHEYDKLKIEVNEWLKELSAFMNFADVIGCFRRKTSQVSSSLINSFLEIEDLKIGNYLRLFGELPNVKADINFVELLKKSIDYKARKIIPNSFLETLLFLRNQKEYEDIFTIIINNFSKIQNRNTLNKDGTLKNLSWIDLLKSIYNKNRYDGITPDNMKVAEVCQSFNLPQEYFDYINVLLKNAKELPRHILGETLKENVMQNIKDDSEEVFTYEWLDRMDPRNAILGLYTNSCANVCVDYKEDDDEPYGSIIAKRSILDKNFQNLVVKNSNGRIIAKGTIYINRNKGYGVFNNFEIATPYRWDGKSSVGKRKSDAIFNAFLRGINAFVEKYNSQGNKTKISRISVGLGENKLKSQVLSLQEKLREFDDSLPEFFIDARKGVKTIYLYEEK